MRRAYTSSLKILVTVLLLYGVAPVFAGDHTVLGKSFLVKDPMPGGDPSRRSVIVAAKEPASDDALVGDPLANGVTLEILANGATSTVQTFALPPGAPANGAGWKALGSPISGYSYKDPKGVNGPVKSAFFKKAGGGTLVIKVSLKGALGPGPQPHITIVPPRPGTDAGMRFQINGGDGYCIALGGAAGGKVSNSSTGKFFRIVSTGTAPARETACPRSAITTPVADAGLDQVVSVGAPVTLDGSASFDPDGDPITYAWQVVAAPVGSVASLTAATTVAPHFTADVAGTYVAQLVVSDGTVSSPPDAVTVIARTPTPPVANAGPDQTVAVVATVHLDGTGSTDANGSPLTFGWTLVQAPPGSAAVLANPTDPRPTFVTDLAGTYVAQLIVNDGAASSAPDTVRISTVDSPPVANAGPDATVHLGATVHLDGSASSDVDGDPLTYVWTRVSAPAGSAATLSDPTAVMPTFVADVAGTYVLQLVVNDGAADSVPDQVVIVTGNSVPVADAGADQLAALGDSVALDGSGSTDADGDPLTYRWAILWRPSGSAATLSDPQAVGPSFTIDVPGTYVVQLIVNDGRQDSVPDTVVVSTIGVPPVADAGPDHHVPVATIVTLDGSGSHDADGNPLTYRWALLSRPATSHAGLGGATTVSPSFTADVAGLYVVQLVVNDGVLDSLPDTVVISTGETRPIADAGPDEGLLVGTIAQLDGTRSSDPDGDPLTWHWTFLSRPRGSGATLSSPTASRPTFLADRVGTYVVQLVVNDGALDSAPATVRITASNVQIHLQVASPLLTFDSATGTVLLDQPAIDYPPGTGGQRVYLSSNHPAVAIVPSSVVVPLGQTTVTFPITTLATAGSANINANAFGFADGNAPVTVLPRGMGISPSAVAVGRTRSWPATIVLAQPAPPGGVNVAVTSAAPAIATVSPATVAIPAGATSGNFTITGQIVDTTTISAGAPGFQSAAAAVTVFSDYVVAPANVTVAPCQTLPYPIALSVPAPAGGLKVTFASSPSGIAKITPSSVTIPAGAIVPSAQPQVMGLALGDAQITASAPPGSGFAPDSETVHVGVGMSLSSNSITVLTDNTKTVVLSLAAQALCSGGVTVQLHTDDAGIATVPASVVVPQGMSSANIVVSGVAVGSTTLHAVAAGSNEATAMVTVTPAPPISLAPAASAVGKDLQVAAGGTLGAPAPAGNLQVTITSGDPSRLRVSASPTVLGSAAGTASVQVGAGSTTMPTVYLQALASAGAVTLTATATGYAHGSTALTLEPAGFVLIGPAGWSSSSFDTTTLSPNTSLSVCSAALDPATLEAGPFTVQALRPGVGPVSVQVASDHPGVATVTTSPVVFAANDSVHTTQLDPQGAGTAMVAAGTPPGFTTPATFATLTATVTAPAINVEDVSVGKDMQIGLAATLGAPAPAGNLQVTFTSSDPTKLRVSASPTALGSGSVTVQAGAGSTSVPMVWLQALTDAGTVTLSATAPRYATGNATVTLAPAGFELLNGDEPFDGTTFGTTTLSAPSSLWVVPVVLDPATLGASGCNPRYYSYCGDVQTLRAGVGPVSIDVVSDMSAVGTVTTSPVVFGTNDQPQPTGFAPQAAGTASISIDTPAGFTTPTSYQTQIATVVAPQISLPDLSVGKDLQQVVPYNYLYAFLAAPAPAGNVDVTITSGDPTKVLLSTDPTVPGAASITLTVFAGSTSIPAYWVQALTNAGTVTLTATAPRYSAGAATVTLVPSGFELLTGFYTTSFATTTLSDDTPLWVVSAMLDPTTLSASGCNPYYFGQCGDVQPLRPGVAPVSIDVVSDTPGVGTVTSSPVVFDTNDYRQTTAFAPRGVGTAMISIDTPPGFAMPSTYQTQTATVSSPRIFLPDFPVGKDLEQVVPHAYAYASLETPASPGNVDVTITSGDPTKLLLSTDPTATGSVSITVTVSAGNADISYWVQALSDTGTVTLMAAAPGYASGAGLVTLAPSGFEVLSGFYTSSFATTTLSDATPLWVASVMLDPTTLNASGCNPYYFGLCTDVQPLRPGAGPISVDVVSDAPAVGTVMSSPVVFDTNEYRETTAFVPQGVGTAVVSIDTPAGFTTASNYQAQTATVSAAQIYLPNVSVGKDLQLAVPSYPTFGAPYLQAPAPPGNVDVTITSGDPSKVLLSADPTVAGSASIVLTVPAGNTGIPTYWVQALDDIGTVPLTVTAPRYAGGMATVTLAPSGFELLNGTGAFGGTSFATTTLSAPMTLWVTPVMLDPVTLNASGCNPEYYPYCTDVQPLRPGVGPIGIDVVSDTPAVGTVTSSPVVVDANAPPQATAFAPRAAGNATIYIDTPAGFTVPSNYQAQAATLALPVVHLPPVSVGKDLEVCTAAAMDAPAPAGGLTVTIAVVDASLATVSSDPAIDGTASIALFVPAGTSVTPTYCIQALDGTGTVQYTATATGWSPGAATITMTPSGFAICEAVLYSNYCQPLGAGFTTSVMDSDTTLKIAPARLDPTTLDVAEVQTLRPDVPGATVAIESSKPVVGTITVSPVTFSGADVPNERTTSFHPVAAGSTVIRAFASGFSTASDDNHVTVNVTP